MDILARMISISAFVVAWDVLAYLIADRRSAWLLSAVLWATWADAITEGLSLFRMLTYEGLLIICVTGLIALIAPPNTYNAMRGPGA